MRISHERKSELHEAIKGPVLSTRTNIAKRELGYGDIDVMLSEMEDEIWRRVKYALGIVERDIEAASAAGEYHD